MKTLKLEHLAPYLPYELTVMHEGHIARIVSYYMPAGNYKKDCWIVSMEDTIDNELSCSTHFSEIKPILRPLSDLTKEIEHNGEKFVPNEYLNSDCKKYCTPEDWDAILFIEVENINSVPYVIVNQLIEWNFDIFNLIQDGLAVDKNTIEL